MRLERTSFARRLEGYTEAVSLPAQPVVEGRLLRMVGLTLEAEGLFERARLPITGAGTDPAAVAGIGGERRCRALGATWHPCC